MLVGLEIRVALILFVKFVVCEVYEEYENNEDNQYYYNTYQYDDPEETSTYIIGVDSGRARRFQPLGTPHPARFEDIQESLRKLMPGNKDFYRAPNKNTTKKVSGRSGNETSVYGFGFIDTTDMPAQTDREETIVDENLDTPYMALRPLTYEPADISPTRVPFHFKITHTRFRHPVRSSKAPLKITHTVRHPMRSSTQALVITHTSSLTLPTRSLFLQYKNESMNHAPVRTTQESIKKSFHTPKWSFPNPTRSTVTQVPRLRPEDNILGPQHKTLGSNKDFDRAYNTMRVLGGCTKDSSALNDVLLPVLPADGRSLTPIPLNITHITSRHPLRSPGTLSITHTKLQQPLRTQEHLKITRTGLQTQQMRSSLRPVNIPSRSLYVDRSRYSILKSTTNMSNKTLVHVSESIVLGPGTKKLIHLKTSLDGGSSVDESWQPEFKATLAATTVDTSTDTAGLMATIVNIPSYPVGFPSDTARLLATMAKFPPDTIQSLSDTSTGESRTRTDLLWTIYDVETEDKMLKKAHYIRVQSPIRPAGETSLIQIPLKVTYTQSKHPLKIQGPLKITRTESRTHQLTLTTKTTTHMSKLNKSPVHASRNMSSHLKSEPTITSTPYYPDGNWQLNMRISLPTTVESSSDAVGSDAAGLLATTDLPLYAVESPSDFTQPVTMGKLPSGIVELFSETSAGDTEVSLSMYDEETQDKTSDGAYSFQDPSEEVHWALRDGDTPNVTTVATETEVTKTTKKTTTTTTTTTEAPSTTVTTTTTIRTTRPTKPVFDIDIFLDILANLTYDYDTNLTKIMNETLRKIPVPTCGRPKGWMIWMGWPNATYEPTTTSTEPYYEHPKELNDSVIAKCFVCGLKEPGIPISTDCADAFAGDFLPLVPVNPLAKAKAASYRKYCRYGEIYNIFENKTRPKSVYGRWTGGCSVRWTDITGSYTQRTCRNRRRAVTGLHYASKRMAKLEMALSNLDTGCIITPAATLLPLSRGVSLYSRFHACVCIGNWCNEGARAQPALIFDILAPVMLTVFAPASASLLYMRL